MVEPKGVGIEAAGIVGVCGLDIASTKGLGLSVDPTGGTGVDDALEAPTFGDAG